MAATKVPDPILLLVENERGRAVYPITPAALRLGQGSKREIRRRSMGARVVFRDGRVQAIEDLKFLGLYGSSTVRKLISALTGAWELQVRLGTAYEPTLQEFKDIIIQHLEDDSKKAEPNIPQAIPLDQVIASIREALTVSDVFDRLHLPPPEDCLDVL